MPLLAEFVRSAALEEGFSLAGIAAAGHFRELDGFPAWIAAGYHGEMEYLARANAAGRLCRAALENVAPWARSVVVCAINYNSAAPHSSECNDPSRGWIARYAQGSEDYHELLLPRLRRLEARLIERMVSEGQLAPRTWCYVDTGPVIERVLAQHAGIGWTGKNGCILNQQLGSWLLLGVILCSHPLAPSLGATDRCGSCTRCLDACPTSAFLGPRQLDATRCISYLTIEQRGPVADELRPAMGRHVFGCDICQEVCPWNSRAPITLEPAFAARPELVDPPLERLATMSNEEFRATFRRSPVKRAKLRGMLRNAAIAMGNSGNPEHLPRLHELARHDDPAVAEHARWAIARLETAADANRIP